MPEINDTDQELLQTFADRSDQRAFAELVDRYLPLVYGAAARRLNNVQLAEEVALGVFATLAEKAETLKKHPSLAGWLLKTAAFQAMRAGKKEQTRMRKIREYQSEATLVRPDEPEGLADPEIVVELDAAILDLPESDRQAILLRFYRQLSFKAIGEILGKRADTCQKQNSRAVEKLQQHFRKRGVSISAVALGSVLTSELAKATPAGIGPAIASEALGGSVRQSTVLLGSMKFAAAIGIAVASIGGYITGRAAGSSKPTAIAEPAAGARDVGSGSLTALTKSPTSAAADRTALLRRMIELARTELHESDYDRAAGRRAIARIAQLESEDIPIALEIVGQLPGGHDAAAALTDAILNHWAATDGRSACEFSLAHRSGKYPLKAPLFEWAKSDPQAAYDWFLEKNATIPPDTENWAGEIVVRPVMSAWVGRDPAAVIEVAKTTEDKGLATGIYWGMLQYGKFIPDANRQKLLDYLHERWGKDAGRKNVGLNEAIDYWGSHRPGQFANWIDAKPHGELHTSAAAQLFKAWQSTDKDAAVAWFLNREDTGGDLAVRKQQLVEAWAATDAIAASQWLAEQPVSPELDGAYAALSKALGRRAKSLMRRSPEEAQRWATDAQRWAEQITDEKRRNELIEKPTR